MYFFTSQDPYPIEWTEWMVINLKRTAIQCFVLSTLFILWTYALSTACYSEAAMKTELLISSWAFLWQSAPWCSTSINLSSQRAVWCERLLLSPHYRKQAEQWDSRRLFTVHHSGFSNWFLKLHQVTLCMLKTIFTQTSVVSENSQRTDQQKSEKRDSSA